MADNTQTFSWVGLNKAGKRVTGVVDVTDKKEIQAELKKRGVEVVSFKIKKRFKLGGGPKVTPKDILLFTRYLSTMLGAGLPILQALEVIGRDQENENLRAFITTLRTNVSGGKTLAETFSQYPDYFNPLYCNLIKTGERSGTLEKILIRLGNYLEKTETLKRKIKKAMIYPMAIVSVAGIVSCILLIFVVPNFATIFKSFGVQLPYFTRIIVGLSDALRAYWWIVVAAFTFIIIGTNRLLRKSIAARELKDRWSLKIYILGPILKKAIIARYTRTLAITLEAGMPIVEGMKSVVDILGNSLYIRAVQQVSNEVMSGNQLYVSMGATKLFPNMVIQMISIGETSGSLAEMLNKVADYYEEDVNSVVDNLSSLLEPLIMAVLGVIIGSFVIAMYLPIFKIGSLF
jgi:type IV pilus assembly protein PilC